MDIRDVFARNLRWLREERDWSQEELAGQADIDRTYVSALERSRYSASIDMVARLADVFGVSASSMLERKPSWLKK
jgi:transcriptional regulator with XRE-family HTH domain